MGVRSTSALRRRLDFQPCPTRTSIHLRWISGLCPRPRSSKDAGEKHAPRSPASGPESCRHHASPASRRPRPMPLCRCSGRIDVLRRPLLEIVGDSSPRTRQPPHYIKRQVQNLISPARATPARGPSRRRLLGNGVTLPRRSCKVQRRRRSLTLFESGYPSAMPRRSSAPLHSQARLQTRILPGIRCCRSRRSGHPA